MRPSTDFCARLLRRTLLPVLVLFAATAARAETNPRFYAVELSASVDVAPARINLRWAPDSNATGYNVYRKAPAATSWTHLTSLASSSTAWSDGNVANGGAYEYAVTKSTSVGYQGTGYILAGINAPMSENRGKILLIVDNTHSAALAPELTRLQQDLVGDGWTVIRHDVPRTATPPTIKNLIKTAYNADPANVKSVFLFGHVAVPYSGNSAVDGHPDHKGAWVADTYYGDIDGTWTDSSVNNTAAEKPWNRNSPGDGKFDQSELPSDIELAVGRVDLYNMTCFANKAWSRSELDLLRAYLNKDHNFRHGRIVVPRRGLVCDNFGETEGEAFASTGWRSFAPFFGAENNVQVPYGAFFSTLRDNGYLWSYGTGGGSWYTCNGVGSSDDFANTEIKTVFTAFLGSYFGDWDNESAFLRAPLGSGYTLASAWGGRPHWFFHPMGLGETIGTAAKLSQNNRYGGLYGGQNWGTRQTHVTLLGDPTLRMHPVIPPANVSANNSTLTWIASTDTAIQGYNVYRATSANGPFTKISGNTPIVNLFFTDASPVSGAVYMVRAVKLEQSGSGTYLNLSQGAFSSGSIEPNPTPTPTAPAAPSNLTGSALSSSQLKLQWADNSSDESGFRLLRKSGASGTYTTLTIAANTTSYSDSNLSAGTKYYYKLQSYNAVGSSAFTSEISVTTQAAPTPAPSGTNGAVFVSNNTTASGSWKGVFGTDGQIAPYSGDFKVPAYVQINANNNFPAVWQNPSTDLRALQKRTTTTRFATRWNNNGYIDFFLKFKDTATHRVSFYFCDFDRLGRQQKLDIYNNVSGQLITSTSIANFANGLYSTWDLKGNIRVRITGSPGANTVLGGIFFDPASTVSNPPSSTAGNAVRFIGANTTLGGTWKSVVGTQGYQVAAEGTKTPSFATISFAGKTDHVWNWSTTDSAALQKSSATDRLASCWYAGTSFDVRVNMTDGQTHKIGFYALDWDIANRSQRVDVIDATTGAVLHTTNLTGFQRGAYLNYDVKGSVIFRFTRTAGPNAVISGWFVDAPSASL